MRTMGSAYVRSDVTYQWISSMIASVVQWSSGGATSGWVAAGTVDIVSAPMKLLQCHVDHGTLSHDNDSCALARDAESRLGPRCPTAADVSAETRSARAVK